MFTVSLLSLVFATTQPAWQTDYRPAYAQAVKEKKDLFIYFRADDHLDDVLEQADVREKLDEFVCLRIDPSYEIKGARLLDHPAFEHMMGRAGIAVVNLHDEESPNYEEMISAHPFVTSRYRWAPGYGAGEIKVILDLPAEATLSQRSMIYAVRVHPERPRSVNGQSHPSFLAHARRHSYRQASMRHQHHANIIAASNYLSSEMGVSVGGASEVVAESWGRFVGGENVLEASFSCVDAWRHSSGHWGAVSRAHRYFGYDISRASNGTWFATGIFAD